MTMAISVQVTYVQDVLFNGIVVNLLESLAYRIMNAVPFIAATCLVFAGNKKVGDDNTQSIL